MAAAASNVTIHTQLEGQSLRRGVQVGGVSLAVALVALGALALLGVSFAHAPLIGALGAYFGKTGALVVMATGAIPLMAGAILNRHGAKTSQFAMPQQAAAVDFTEGEGTPLREEHDDAEDDLGGGGATAATAAAGGSSGAARTGSGAADRSYDGNLD